MSFIKENRSQLCLTLLILWLLIGVAFWGAHITLLYPITIRIAPLVSYPLPSLTVQGFSQNEIIYCAFSHFKSEIQRKNK